MSVYDGAKKKNTKWWHALKEERVRDREAFTSPC
jgi:hypothetical protein